ncbi:D-alanyl-D-alanine carboxypeptidase [Enterocloster aldenensis]|uniref:D-alanyl-D-alanine carboxypeptidase family protein n=1 Tax=Enterocloster aldenensis TaxID=358742 RepID=UPI000E40176A|nr:D-alanyl-D-alanine carboxypeptidase family protein [uncultured Lachnoclostridium sp.]MCB7333923.1 D-alanyl-D-alanine carboxypeptidase [Enterocloster aldenensis]MCI5487070.1 D-alanyl-D-alanine carboxypeptidase [Enterocloster aldenensis]MDY4533366.1 D-alanyl-D-alanine carboxypeptidase family protein [Enterocloster aldenensis]RGC27191.1 D-alanyl-D-alanine carboxypeptidase [Enterocloster aldenensis]
MKRASALLCALLFTASMGLTGCFGGLKEAYVASERIPALEEETAATRFSDAFASDLCVVTDEASYDPDFVTSQAAALFDMDDREVLYSKDVFERMYPASITKIMTALVAIKEGDLKSRVLVTDDAVITEPGATLCGIEPGDTLTLEQLLYGLMLPSGNDAGAAIAVHIAGSIEAFSDMMNEEAVRLGATGTHFVNPHGLNDPDHYTTAYDLYLIFNEALKYPVFRQIVGTTAYTANYHNKNSEPVSKTWKGSNWFMTGERETPDGLKVFGGKTGTTKAAGYCLIMASRDDSDKEYISVVLKADSRPHLYDNMTNIISKIVK